MYIGVCCLSLIMPKSRANIQRAYHDRKKNSRDSMQWRKKECKRKKRSYVPMAQLSDRSKRLRRRYVREQVSRWRINKKKAAAKVNATPLSDFQSRGIKATRSRNGMMFQAFVLARMTSLMANRSEFCRIT